MRVRGLMLATLFFTVMAFSIAAIPTGRYSIVTTDREGKLTFLTAAKGQLVMLRRSSNHDDRDTPDRWVVFGRKIKSSVGSGYLAYDPSGKDDRVFLTSDANAKGTEWAVRQPADRKRKTGTGLHKGAEWGTVQVFVGPKAGWFLDIEEVQEKQGEGRKPLISLRLILREKPLWNVEVEQIYDHK